MNRNVSLSIFGGDFQSIFPSEVNFVLNALYKRMPINKIQFLFAACTKALLNCHSFSFIDVIKAKMAMCFGMPRDGMMVKYHKRATE